MHKSRQCERLSIIAHSWIALGGLLALGLWLTSISGQQRFYLPSQVLTSLMIETDFRMALDESAGFFDNIPRRDWQLIRQRIESTPKCAMDCAPSVATAWYQNNWEPAITCQHERRIGRWGDGGKWVCDPYRIMKNKQSCLVYSVGSNNDFSFEESVWRDVSSECEIHTFDPTIGEMPSNLPSGNIKFHPWGLSETDNGSSKTLPSIISTLGHTGREIDILKIDCEGCEWLTYETWFDGNTTIRQIQLEVHGGTEEAPPTSAQTFMLYLKSKGYVIFHKEPNIQYIESGWGICVEYAFLLLDLGKEDTPLQ